MFNPFSLKNKTILVTGASSGATGTPSSAGSETADSIVFSTGYAAY